MTARPDKRWDQPPAVVVWDVDDTLMLERDFARSGFAAVGAWLAAERGLEGFSEAAWAIFEAGGRGTIFNQALARLGVGPQDPALPELIATLVRVYREHPPAVALLPDAAAALAALRAAAIPMAVITDGPVVMQAGKVRALGLAALAAPIVLAWARGEAFGKPHPSAFEEVQRHHGAAGDRLVYIADNPLKDFIAPRRLGWRTLRIRRPGGLHAAADSGADVDCELTSLTAAPAVLGV